VETTVVPTNGHAAADIPGAQPITLVRLQRRMVRVPIVGRTPYLAHRWGEKALRLMREAQSGSGRVKKDREAKNAEQEAFDATWWLVPNEVPGAPAVAFKAAMVGAVRSFEGITMVGARTMLYVRGEGPEQLVPLLDAGWTMREVTPRLANGNPDLRYRNAIFPWRAELEIEFPVQRLSTESVLALVDEAGRGGIGDWRPSSPKSATGTFGQWALDESRPVEVLR
jgi:hypothetical protein